MFEVLQQQLPQFLTWENGGFFLRAMWTTLMMTILGCGTGFVLGFVVVLIRRIPGLLYLPLRLVTIAYVEFFRRVPFLVLLFLVLFMTKGVGLDISLFTVASVSIVIVSTAFVSEIIRAGLDSVHQTQSDTAHAMNFNRLQSLWYVILPQAWKVIIPPAFAFFVMFIKDTALASQVGVLELTQAGKYFNNLGFSAILSFGSILVLYFVLSYPLTRLGWWIEARLKTRMHRPRTAVPVQTAYELRQT